MTLILKLLGIIILFIFLVFCIIQAIKAAENIIALRKYRKDPTSLPHRESMVFNKKTGKLEGDNSPILPN